MSRHKKSKQSDVRGTVSQTAEDTTQTADRERVAHRAYELYLERGGADGHADEDWLSAERKIFNGRASQER